MKSSLTGCQSSVTTDKLQDSNFKIASAYVDSVFLTKQVSEKVSK